MSGTCEHTLPKPQATVSAPIALQDDHDGSVRVHSGNGYRFVVPFPWRLHQLLNEMNKTGDTSIICWRPDGRHFQVKDQVLFTKKIIPKYFKQTSFKSFQRQLGLYGFQRSDSPDNHGAYYHKDFIRGNPKLSLKITRSKAPPRRRLGLQAIKKTKGESRSDVSQNVASKPSANDTTEWLICSGVPFSALDPLPVFGKQDGENPSPHLMECAEEIKSIFTLGS